MIAALVLLPLLAGGIAYFLRNDALRRFLLAATAFLHFALCCAAWLVPAEPMLRGWLVLDSLGLLFLTISSLIFLAIALYAVGYFKESLRKIPIIRNPEAGFTACLLFILSTMSLVCASQHLGLLWIALEASTLVSAPLIYFRRNHRSLEATWKYLMICSIGLALALLGNYFLAVAASTRFGASSSLVVGDLIQGASGLHSVWLRAAFLFMLIGYGTKMGLAPLHNWLPDAHSEAPSVISALLSGALLNCAFLAILRIYQVCIAADQGAFCDGLLRGFGLLSIAMAAVFILNQKNFKRILAYSSVEHMGILTLGVGLGGAATFGAMLHTVNHSLVKAMLFLLAGNIIDLYQSKKIGEVRGVLRAQRFTGALWLVGLFAITGFPPFGTFLSEFIILKGAFERGFVVEAVALLACLSLIFIGMSGAFLGMAQGKSEEVTPRKSTFLSIASPCVLCALALFIGCYLPPALHDVLQAAARSLGGS